MPQYQTVAELLADPARWCQGAYAKDCIGVPLPRACDCRAESWCLVGAVVKVYGLSWELDQVLCRLADAIRPGCVWRENQRLENQRLEDWVFSQPHDGSARQVVSDWSEAPGRTWEEVWDLVRKVGV